MADQYGWKQNGGWVFKLDAKFCVSTMNNKPENCGTANILTIDKTAKTWNVYHMDEILFRGKYRIPSTRLTQWDYGQSGWYFVTICVNGKYPFFGEINNDTMLLSEMGRIAQQCWSQIPDHFPNVQLDEFIIMPDHIHGIIVIKSPVETQNLASNSEHVASNPQNTSTPKQSNQNAPQTHGNIFGPQSKNLASIVRGFKIGVTQWARTNGEPFFMWQSRYHDHIIHDEPALNKIREYIRDNPIKYGLTL